MARLIIDYPDDMTATNALEFVQKVVVQGKISHSNGVPHFCWLTMIKAPKVNTHDNPMVMATIITRVKKKGQKSDSLIVRRGM
jgi:hypothetical protein